MVDWRLRNGAAIRPRTLPRSPGSFALARELLVWSKIFAATPEARSSRPGMPDTGNHQVWRSDGRRQTPGIAGVIRNGPKHLRSAAPEPEVVPCRGRQNTKTAYIPRRLPSSGIL